MTTQVYGCSDDLIEFEGDVSGEEYGGYAPTLLAISDGTLLFIQYGETDGIWHIRPLREGELFDHIQVCPGDSDDEYSDRAFFKDGVKWAYAANKPRKVT